MALRAGRRRCRIFADDRAVGLPGVPEPDGERAAGTNRFQWYPGANDDIGQALRQVYPERSRRAQGRPFLTLREHTDRPVTVSQGTNTVTGYEPQRIVAGAMAILDRGAGTRQVGCDFGGRSGARSARLWGGSLDRQAKPGVASLRTCTVTRFGYSMGCCLSLARWLQ